MRIVIFLSTLAFAAWPHAVLAHVMQVPYNLPVPFWLYAYGATGALLASFVVVGYFVRADAGQQPLRTIDLNRGGLVAALTSPAVVTACRVATVALLLAAIVTGFAGSRVPTRNFNITLFWVVFVLGFTYLVAIVGDVYRAINPWRALCDWIETIRPGALAGRIACPRWLGCYPALLLYMAFIWIELFGRTNPPSLSWVLVGYTVLNVVAAWLVGKETWFRDGEFFAIFFRLIGMMAPVEYGCPERGSHAVVRARPPFLGLLETPARHPSLLIFVLFMLSSTAFDGIHETVPWVQLFWKHVYPVLERHIAVGYPQQYLVLVDYYYYWQWLMMLVSPFVYLVIYLFFIALTKLITRSTLSIGELSLRFALSLVPIAFVYNVTHYFTLLVSQGPYIVNLASDPLGNGWNLLGTKDWMGQPVMLDAGVIWHTQVGLILGGHIVSVYLAHVEALKVFGSSRKAALSQVPLLLLMVLLTTIGLWILSLPIAAGQVLLPTPGA